MSMQRATLLPTLVLPAPYATAMAEGWVRRVVVPLPPTPYRGWVALAQVRGPVEWEAPWLKDGNTAAYFCYRFPQYELLMPNRVILQGLTAVAKLTACAPRETWGENSFPGRLEESFFPLLDRTNAESSVWTFAEPVAAEFTLPVPTQAYSFAALVVPDTVVNLSPAEQARVQALGRETTPPPQFFVGRHGMLLENLTVTREEEFSDAELGLAPGEPPDDE